MISRSRWIPVVTAVLALLIGCGPGTPAALPAATPGPTTTVVPPTETPVPPPTVPTAVPTREPTATPAVLTEEVTLVTTDSVTLAATLFGEGEVAVMLLHMGAGGATQTSWHPLARDLAERGFAALTLDFRGVGRSEGRLQYSRLIYDARAAYEFLRGRGYHRIICMGASMGGTSCIRLAMGVELEGVVVLASTVSTGDPNTVTVAGMTRLTMPKLFVVGSRDVNDVVKDTKKMYWTCPEPKELVIYNQPSHGTALFATSDGDNLRQKLLDFVDMTASAPPTATPQGGPVTSSDMPIDLDTVARVECLRTLRGHNDKVYNLDFSGDGVYLASGGADRTIRLWDLRSGQEVHTFSASEACLRNIDFSPSGCLLASYEAIWDVESKQLVHRLRRGLCSPVAFSPDGSILAVSGFDQPIELWDVASGEVVRTFDNNANSIAGMIEFSPDGTRLATGGHQLGGTVKLWDVETGQLVNSFAIGPESRLHGMAFSPDGNFLAAAGGEGTAKIWDVASGQVVHTMHGTGCYDVTFSPDGSLLATAGCDNTVKLWDAVNWQLVRTLNHADNVTAVAFSPDGTLLASGAYDSQTYLWGISR